MSLPAGEDGALVRVGIDEVGRGCLAGPVWACAYALRPGSVAVEGVRDSKKLSARRREQLCPALEASGWFAHGVVQAEMIDQIGIQQATLLAMRLALVGLQRASALSWQALEVIVDGNVTPAWPELAVGSIACLVRADDLVHEVSAASVLAKVARDAHMAAADEVHQGYGFRDHAGYGTAAHLKAIAEQGACQLHRMSFEPLKSIAPPAARLRPRPPSPRP